MLLDRLHNGKARAKEQLLVLHRELQETRWENESLKARLDTLTIPKESVDVAPPAQEPELEPQQQAKLILTLEAKVLKYQV